jgi:hypothetical protein
VVHVKIPEQYQHAVIPHILVDWAAEAIRFYTAAFGASEYFRLVPRSTSRPRLPAAPVPGDAADPRAPRRSRTLNRTSPQPRSGSPASCASVC